MFIELSRKRRSIRKYDNKLVEKEKIDLILEAALRSPASRGVNSCELIVITDKDKLRELSLSREFGSQFLINAPLGIVVCGNPLESDVWIENASIAAVIIHLAATSLDLGSCWIQIRNRAHNNKQSAEDYIRKLLGIPDETCVEAIVGIGYPAEKKPVRAGESLAYHKVHYNNYGNQILE
jgi:nitroreductase